MAWHIRTTKAQGAFDTGAQCTLLPSNHKETEPVTISGETGGSQELTLLVAEVSLTPHSWEKYPVVTGPDAPYTFGIHLLQKGYFKDPKGYKWAVGIAAVGAYGIGQLSISLKLSDDPFVVGLMKLEDQKLLTAAITVHRRQY